MTLQYWFMFPIATTAMASGVGGATFFSLLFILALGLSPEIAIGTGLLTEVFGFASGVYAYARKRLIDYRLGMALLMVTIPASLLGTLVAGWVEPNILKVVLGVGLFVVAISFLRAPEHKDVERSLAPNSPADRLQSRPGHDVPLPTGPARAGNPRFRRRL